MKRIVLATIVALVGCSAVFMRPIIIRAQTLPYTLTVTWDVEPTATSYNCYLDNTLVVNVTTNLCSFPVTVKGPHTVGVTTVNSTFVPPESTQTNLAFVLQAPNSPKGIKVK